MCLSLIHIYISASLDDYSTGSGATLNGATVTGNTHTCLLYTSGGLHGHLAAFFRQGEGFHAGGAVSDAGIADPLFVGADALHDGGGAGLFLHGVFVVPLLQGCLLYTSRCV